jgi:hypothetical protein
MLAIGWMGQADDVRARVVVVAVSRIQDSIRDM